MISSYNPDEKYFLYQIYPFPEDCQQKILSEIKNFVRDVFTDINRLYFIATEENFKNLKEKIPPWLDLNKVPTTGLDEIIQRHPEKRWLFEKIGLWKPPVYTGRGPGRKSKRRRR